MRKGFLLGTFLFLALNAFGQGARYNDTVTDQVGRPVPASTVYICSLTATGTPCSPTVSIYQDSGLTTPISNPLTTDNYGRYGFWISPGSYLQQVSGQGIITYTEPFTVGGTGGSTSPGGVNGQVQINNDNAFGGGNISGDCSTSNSLAVTCTKTNGVLFAPQATKGFGNGVEVIDASLFTGADWSYQVNAAIASCPAAACVVDARGFSSPVTMSQSIDLKTPGNGPLTLMLPAQINRSSGAQFEMENYARVIGLGRGSSSSGNSSTTYIYNGSGDTVAVFANNTGGAVSWFVAKDLTIRSEGPFTVKDSSGNPHSVTYSTGICFDFTTQLDSSIEGVSVTCQIALRLGQPNFVGAAYYNFFKDDTFASVNPNGVVVQMGSYPNENNFYATRFVTYGSAVFMNGVGGWVNFNGGDIEGAGAGVVIYDGTNIGIHDVYFEAISPTTGAPAYAVWQANWPYIAGAVIQDSNGHTEVCVTAGTSGASAPSWSGTAGGTTTDNSATWLRTNNGQVVLGPLAIGNTVDGAIGPQSIDNFSTWGGGASNYVFVPPSDSGAGGIAPYNFTATQFSLGTSLCGNGGGCGANNSYTIEGTEPSNNIQGIGVDFGGASITEGYTGHAPVQNGGTMSAGGRSGTFMAGSLNVVGLPNPGVPTVTLYGSHAGSSTVSYALTANTCGGGTYSGGTLTGAFTLPGSFTQITNAPATAGALISVAVTTGGTGYSAGTYTLVNPFNSNEGGTSTGQVTITVNGSGVVTGASVATAGNGYPDGYTGATITGGGGSGATFTITAYDLVIITPGTFSLPGFVSQPFSGCQWDVIKDPTGGSSTSQSILTQQFPNMLPIGLYSSTPLLGQLLDYGQSLSSYSEPGTRNTTADSLFDGNLGVMGAFETLGSQNYFGYSGNTFFDFLHAGNQFIIGRNTPESTSGYQPFQIYDDSTHAHEVFYVKGAGSSSGSDGVFTLNNTLEDGSGNMTSAGYMNAVGGFKYNNSATSGHYLRGNGSQYVDSAIQNSDVPNPFSPTNFIFPNCAAASYSTCISGATTGYAWWFTGTSLHQINGPKIVNQGNNVVALATLDPATYTYTSGDCPKFSAYSVGTVNDGLLADAGGPCVYYTGSLASGDVTKFSGTSGNVVDAGFAASAVTLFTGSLTSGHLASWNSSGGQITDSGIVASTVPTYTGSTGSSNCAEWSSSGVLSSTGTGCGTSTPISMITHAFSGTVSSGSTTYFGTGPGLFSSSGSSGIDTVLPFGGTITAMYCALAYNHTGTTATFQLYHNGSSSGITAANISLTGGALRGSATGLSISVSQGDDLTTQLVMSGTNGASAADCTYRVTGVN